MIYILLSALVAVVSILPLQADTFGTGLNQFTIDFTTIGNAGQQGVPYAYAIGTYDISVNQLNSASASGAVGLPNGYWSGDQPAANISWFQAAAFVNWLDTSTGHQAAYNLTYSNGSYTMDLWHSWDAGYDPNNLYRNKNAVYVLPSRDEWYKAAYGKIDGSGYYLYPTGSDTVPTAVASATDPNTAVYGGVTSQPASVYAAGRLSSYGAMGMGGNVWHWVESSFNYYNDSPTGDRLIRAGSLDDTALGLQSTYAASLNPELPEYWLGIRVAAVPEPSTYALIGIGALALVFAYRRRVS